MELRRPARPAAATVHLEAVVARVDFGRCVLRGGSGAPVEAVVEPRLMGRRRRLDNTVVVGDAVRYSVADGRAVVVEVRPRRNAFSRRAAGERPSEQVVAANLDQLVLVASMVEPEFRPGLVDRVLCQAEHAGIPARLVVNKCDLAREAGRSVVADYARAGYPGHLLSARTGEGVDALREACRGRRTLFIGHSGVGKSTLLNALVPAFRLLAREVSPRTGKGRHTTTAAWLLAPEPGLELIDTPGVRTFGLWGVGPRDLDRSYPEFRPHLGACRFRDCRHDAEPGCALRAAADSGEIAPRRLRSFLKLRDELERERARG
jgi:ribosome biogenesis GTPase